MPGLCPYWSVCGQAVSCHKSVRWFGGWGITRRGNSQGPSHTLFWLANFIFISSSAQQNQSPLLDRYIHEPARLNTQSWILYSINYDCALPIILGCVIEEKTYTKYHNYILTTKYEQGSLTRYDMSMGCISGWSSVSGMGGWRCWQEWYMRSNQSSGRCLLWGEKIPVLAIVATHVNCTTLSFNYMWMHNNTHVHRYI